MNRLETYSLLEPIINAIDNSMMIDTIIDNLDGTYKLEMCFTKWLTIGSNIVIDGEDYKVIDFEYNDWIKVEGLVLPTIYGFEIDLPFKFRGTIIATSEELNNINLSWNKFPMIYLHEIVRERFNDNEEETIERESECDLYFLVDSNNQDWLTKDHYSYAIRPMRSLLFEFISALNNSKTVGAVDTYEVFDHAKFGVYFSDKGHTKKIFNDDLSGTQLKITIPFLKGIDCAC